MRKLSSVTALLVLLTIGLAAQPANLPNSWVGAGVTWNQYASPQVSGVAVYAHKLAGTNYPTYSWTAIDFISLKTSPFTLATTTETGIGQYITSFGAFDLYGIGAAGITTSASGDGTTVGSAFSGGGMAVAKLGKGWTVSPVVRIIRPANSGNQWAVGLIIGWGK